MKSVILGLLFWFTLVLPGSSRGAEPTEFSILPISEGILAEINKDAFWRACGSFFAAAESTEGRVVIFSYERWDSGADSGRSTKFIITYVNRLTVSINEKVPTPSVIILYGEVSNRYILKMRFDDYKAGLACLTTGTNI